MNIHSSTSALPSVTGPVPLGCTGDGKTVIDRHNSHCSLAPALLKEALHRLDTGDRPFVTELIQFDKPIGFTACVETRPGDEIVYAQRLNRKGLSRIVLNREPEACSTVFLVLKRIEPTRYLLITGFVGKRPLPEPWDANAAPDSLPFWRAHALIVPEDEIAPGTLIREAGMAAHASWPSLPHQGPPRHSGRGHRRHDSRHGARRVTAESTAVNR